MPARSKAQAIAMAIAEHEPGKLYKRNQGMMSMSHSQMRDFSTTKRTGLPEHIGKSIDNAYKRKKKKKKI